MSAPRKVLVISASTRPTRICPDIARWVMEVGACAQLAFELVDLAAWPLPMGDEPDVPATGRYAHEHTRAWSRKVSEAAAFSFVTPQYNWGYPAPLKNALDHLYAEWLGKPAIIVSYGFHGGGKCAAQLREVLAGLRMKIAPTMPALSLPQTMKTQAVPTADIIASFGAAAPSIRTSVAELSALLGAA